MKRVLWISSVVVGSALATGQGIVNFSNLVPGAGLNAPMIDGQTQAGLDSRYVAQLYAGPTAESLTPVGAFVPFRDGAAAGYFVGGSLVIPFLNPENGGHFQVRFWQLGFAPTWEQALATMDAFWAGGPWGSWVWGQSAPLGESNTFHLAPLGDLGASPPGLPVALVGLRSSMLFVPIPEPNTVALGLASVCVFGLNGLVARKLPLKRPLTLTTTRWPIQPDAGLEAFAGQGNGHRAVVGSASGGARADVGRQRMQTRTRRRCCRPNEP